MRQLKHKLTKSINHGKHGRHGKTTLYFRIVRVFHGFGLLLFVNVIQWVAALSWIKWVTTDVPIYKEMKLQADK